MIRLIQRRLIIPRGDTGSFSIPVLSKGGTDNIAVFTIFDETTRTKMSQKIISGEGDVLTIAFTHSDTVNLKPGKYVWDIKYYKNPEYIDNELVNGEEIDSYYAGFSLPVCEIRETADNYLVSPEAPTATLSPEQLEIVTGAIHSLNEAIRKTQENVEHYPEIRDEVWHVWDAELGDYVSTDVQANGIVGNGIASAVLNNDYTLTLNFTDGTSFTSPSIRGQKGNGIDDIVLNNNFTLTISYTDGESYTTPSIRGPIGPTPQFSIGTVQDGAVAAASVTGTAENPVLNLTLPNANVPVESGTELGSVKTKDFTYNGVVYSNIANARASFAEGMGTKASGTASHAEGGQTIASGNAGAHAEGAYTTASGNGSHAEGMNTSALGVGSHTEGRDSQAINAQSHAEGLGTYAQGLQQHVQGRYNAIDSGAGIYADIVGNGTYFDIRSNAYALDWDGNGHYAGDVYVGCNSDSTGGTKLPTDIQVNGVSVVTDGVANVPLASPIQLGVVYANGPDGGISVDTSGLIKLATPSLSELKALSTNKKAALLGSLHHAVFYALAKAAGDSTQSASANAIGTYTSEAKTAIQSMLDVPSNASVSSAIASAVGNVHEFGVEIAQTLPTENIKDHTIYFVPKTGDTNDVYDEYIRVNNAWEMIGNTQIDLSNYVQKTDYATGSEAGVVKVNNTGVAGLAMQNGELKLFLAQGAEIKSGANNFKPIVPTKQHESTFYGLAKAAGDSTQSVSENAVGTYTNEAKAAIQQMLSVPSTTDLSNKADKADTILDTTLSRGRKSNTTVGTGSFTFGDNVEASGAYSTAFGRNTAATGQGGFAEGQYTTASYMAHAEGGSTTAAGMWSHAEGRGTEANGAASHASGDSTIANGADSFVFGKYNAADSYDNWPTWTANTSYEVGDRVKRNLMVQNEPTDVGYHCTVANNDATFDNAHWELDGYHMNYVEIVGNGDEYEDPETHQMVRAGSNAYALEWNGTAHYAGDVYVNANANSTGGTKVAKITDIPIENGSAPGSMQTKTYISENNVSHIAMAIGEGSFAHGWTARAIGPCSHAEGNGTSAEGQFSHAEGQGTITTGMASHAEGGATTTASGNYSHAEGNKTVAAGAASHSEGQRTYSNGAIAHTEGENNFNNARGSLVSGTGNELDSSQNYMFVHGVYSNTPNTAGVSISVLPKNSDGTSSGAATNRTLGIYAEIIGNGTADNSRSNAYALDWDGNGHFAGDVYVGANADSSGGTKLAKITDIPSVPVQDVQVNGVSVLDAQGVAEIPLASSSVPGVVRVNPNYGFEMDGTAIRFKNASDVQLKAGTNQYRTISPSTQHTAVFYGLSKVAGVDLANETVTLGTYPETSKTAIKAMLGVQDGLKVVRLI